ARRARVPALGPWRILERARGRGARAPAWARARRARRGAAPLSADARTRTAARGRGRIGRALGLRSSRRVPRVPARRRLRRGRSLPRAGRGLVRLWRRGDRVNSEQLQDVMLERERIANRRKHWVRAVTACNSKCLFCLDSDTPRNVYLPEEVVKGEIDR